MSDRENIVSMPTHKGRRTTRRSTTRQSTTRQTDSQPSPSDSRPSSPSSSPPPQRAASLLHYRPKSDLHHELTTNVERYMGEEWVSVRRFPGHIATAIDQVRKRVDGRTPGFNPTVACAIHLGLTEIEEQRSVLDLRDIKDRLDLIEDADTDVLDSLYGWFRYFPISTSDTRMAGDRRRNISMPPEIKSDLIEVSEETGIAKTDLITVCAESVLMLQPEVGKGYKVRFEASVNRFYKLVEIRRRLGDELVRVASRWDGKRPTSDE